MAYCANCGKKIGLFERRYDFKDKNGNSIKYCGKCNDEWCHKEYMKKLREEEERRKEKLKEEEERRKEKLKEEEERRKEKLKKEKEREEKIQEYIRPFIDQNECIILSVLDTNIINHLNLINTISIQANAYYYVYGAGLSEQDFHSRKDTEKRFRYYIEKILPRSPADFDKVFHIKNAKHLFCIAYSKLWKLISEDKIERLQILVNKRTGEQYGLLDLISQIISTCKNVIYSELEKQLKTENINNTEELFSKVVEYFGETVCFIEQIFEYAQKNNMAKIDRFDFYDSFNEFIRNREITDFEKELFNPNIPKYSIEDVDTMNGFEFEDFLSKLFKSMGYKVEQTKLSGDQGADLLIERNKNLTVVQAKCYSGKISNKAVQEVVASIKHYKATNGMIVANSYFTPSAIELAYSNEIRLIDRDKLKELIKQYMNINESASIETTNIFNLDDNTLEIKCPKCEFEFKHTLDPNERSFETFCPRCNSQMSCSLKGSLICPNCNKRFDTLQEIKDHLKSCKKLE